MCVHLSVCLHVSVCETLMDEAFERYLVAAVVSWSCKQMLHYACVSLNGCGTSSSHAIIHEAPRRIFPARAQGYTGVNSNHRVCCVCL